MNEATTLTELLESRSHDESAIMLIHCGVPVSFAAMLEESRKFATGLQTLGVKPGDRVAIWLPTTPAWLACFFACARIGAVAVAVNTRFVARELTDIVGRSGSRVLVCWPGFHKVDYASVLAGCDAAAMPGLEKLVVYSEANDVARPMPTAWPLVSHQELMRGEPMTRDHSRPQSPCLIFTTSGTTKAPKFVLHDQRALVRHALDVVLAHGFHASSVLLLAPPMCGAFGLCFSMAALAAGRPMVTAPVWDPAQAARWVDEYGVTHLHAVDDAIAQLLDQNDRNPAFPTLEYSGYGAFNPALKDILARAQQRGLRLVGMYGTSEIQGLFCRQSQDAPAQDRVLAGGQAASPLVRVRARNLDTGAIQAHGVPGELEIFAPSSRMVEYYGNPAATAAAFTEDGFYRTGDLGYTQDDGRFVFLTRIGDALRLGGFLVSPLEIEAVLQEFSGIDGCQVVDANVDGVPRPVAFVRLVPGTRLDEPGAIAFAAVRLARYKVPVRVIAIDAFPITEGASGVKIQKTRLRELAQKHVGQSTQGDKR